MSNPQLPKITLSIHKRRGLTVVELLLVVAIISIISLMTVSFFGGFFNQNAVVNVTDQMVGSLRKAQIYSMTGRKNNSWGVNYGSNKITLFQGTNYASRVSGFDETFTVPSSVSITGFTEVYFARMTGIPSSIQSITITGGSNTKTITLNSQGVINK